MRLFFTFLSLLFIGIVVSCEPVPKLEFPKTPTINQIIYLDPTFTDEQKAEIVSGLKAWECATSGYISFKIYIGEEKSDKTVINIENVSSEYPIIVAKDFIVNSYSVDKKRVVAGLFIKGIIGPSRILLVGSRFSKQTKPKNITIHEIGHSLGLDHIDGEKSVMNPFLDTGSEEITELDIENFCRAYSCNPKRFKTCN